MNKLRNAPGWDSEKLEELANEIYQWLVSNRMWVDVQIYYDGKCMKTNDGNNFRYNGEPFITEDVDPREYFEYVADPHILSMSFEGTLYDILNYNSGSSLETDFINLFNEYGLYYEMGHMWNLTCYPL